MALRNLIMSRFVAAAYYSAAYLLGSMNYVVSEYPKSGATWFSQMLSDYLQVDFPRNRPPKLTVSVIQGHFSYSSLFRKPIYFVRDGRDVMVSYYFYSLFTTDRPNQRLVEATRDALPFDDYEDIVKNLPAFIEFKFERPRYPRFTWSESVNDWADKNVPIVRYEDLLAQPVETMSRVIQRISGVSFIDRERLQQIVQKYSFEAQTKRRPGEENVKSFLRKGVAGDWRNHFSLEARQLFAHYAGAQLIQLGYESDNSWVERADQLEHNNESIGSLGQ